MIDAYPNLTPLSTRPKFLAAYFERFTSRGSDLDGFLFFLAATDDGTQGPIHHVLLDLFVHLVIFYCGQDVDERAQGNRTRPHGGGFPGHCPF